MNGKILMTNWNFVKQVLIYCISSANKYRLSMKIYYGTLVG